jgi:GNAT superfamily N-acetyltransferase
VSVDVRIRPIVGHDVADCVGIDDEARRGLVEHRGGTAWLAEHPPLGELTHWWSSSFVAEIDDVIVGFLVGGIDETERGRLFRVDRVYVLAEARELGCGDDLLAAAMAYARDEGCEFLEAVALPGDRDTKNLYERAGVTARAITVSKRLSAPANSEDASR